MSLSPHPLRLLLVAVLPLAVACELYGAGAPVTPSSDAPDVPDAPDLRVLSADEVSASGLRGQDLNVTFPNDRADGSAMLDAWFAKARASGSRVSDLALYVVHDRDADAVECRTAIFPETTAEPRFVPPSSRVENVYRPVQRMASHLESRCQLVSHPETHAETRYTSQYDFASKSMRSVPQTQMVTRQAMRNECHLQPVTSMVTQWEWTPELRFTPPTTQYLLTRRVREGAPVCYAVARGASSRVEGKVLAEAASEE